MPRKLKSYVTSLGFFDLAIAAPSMKAALAAWGSNTNLFHQGLAKQSDDPDVVTATMAHPGIVLRRPVGSNGRFREHAALPRKLSGDEAPPRPAKARRAQGKLPRKVDDEVARKAAVAFEKAERQREIERRKEEALREKEQERRHRAIAKAETALENANREHEKKLGAIEGQRAAIDRRWQAEQARWEKQKEKLESGLRRSRD